MNAIKEADDLRWGIVSTKKMISYGFGGIIGYHLSIVYTLIIFFYLEVEIGLAIGLVALSYIIYAIWNMINDPIIGYLTDRPFFWTRKYGMRFPWIIIGYFLAIMFFFLVFTIPDIDVKTNPWPIFWYIVIMTCLFETFYTLFSIHYYGAFTNQFHTDYERSRASSIHLILSAFGSLGLTMIPPMIIVYGNKNTYILSMFIVSLLLAICAIVSIPGILESDELKQSFITGYETAEKVSFLGTMKKMLHQKNYRIYCIISVLFLIANGLFITSDIYFFKDVLGLPYQYIVLPTLASFIGIILGIPIWVNLNEKIGNVKTYTLGLFLVSLSFLTGMWITTYIETIIYSFTGGIIFGGLYYSQFLIVADVNDEYATKVGKRQEASLLGTATFIGRLSIIFQALILALVHIATGYNPDPHSKQTDLAKLGIRIHYALIPSILAFTAAIIMYKWYDLKGEKKQVIKQKLKEMKL